MLLVKSFGNSIFYVRDRRQIFKYNLITKQKHLRYETKLTIQDYYISRNDRIIVENNFIKRSRPTVTIIWNNRCFVLPFQYSSLSFVKICARVYTVFVSDHKTITCDCEGNIAFFAYSDCIDVSENMKQLILIRNNDVCVLQDNERISNPVSFSESFKVQIDKFKYLNRIIAMTDFYCAFGLLIVGNYRHKNAQWITNSNRIIISSNDFEDNHTLMNIQTLKKCSSTTGYSINRDIHLLEIQNNHFITINNYHINVYDVDTMSHIKKIYSDLTFIGYSKRFDLLISHCWEYYRITTNIKLKKIHRIGYSYFEDRDYIVNTIRIIMDVVLCNDLFSQLPLEILCSEFYREILKYID